jgi:hypothetical protein
MSPQNKRAMGGQNAAIAVDKGQLRILNLARIGFAA